MNKKPFFAILYVLLIGIVFSSCSLFEDDEPDPPDMNPDWLSNNYTGTLYVRYTNNTPEWDVTTQVEVEIIKELGTIEFAEGTLVYSGETLVSADSKIVRNGSWEIQPIGEIVGDVEHPTINVDAQITVQNDIQKIYAKNNLGDWVLVNETDFSGMTPDSQLVFDLDDAVLEGSVCGASTATGSIIWTLGLSIVPNSE
jgi:hypothetical protein